MYGLKQKIGQQEKSSDKKICWPRRKQKLKEWQLLQTNSCGRQSLRERELLISEYILRREIGEEKPNDKQSWILQGSEEGKHRKPNNKGKTDSLRRLGGGKLKK
jgi:hypothetical protein